MAHDVAGLIAALPDIAWSTDTALLRQRSRDFFWYSPVLKRQLAGVVGDALAMPRDEAEVIRILAACHARRIPVTPRGAGTGNYGQAMPLQGGVVLDLSDMDRVVWAREGAVRTQAGARISEIDRHTRAALGRELRFHPSTWRTASIGGFIAGGSSGIGSCTWGTLQEPGNVLGLRVVTMEAEPRVLELRGPDVGKATHAYGANGVITEVEMPLAPAEDWQDLLFAFPELGAAARFADALTRDGGITKKMACVLAAPILQDWCRPFAGLLAPGAAAVLAMLAPASLPAAAALLARHGGREVHRAATAGATTPLYEFSWNHTTLQAMKHDRRLTYLQSLFPAPDHLALVAQMEALFGDEVPIHLEFVRLNGAVCCFGLQLLRFTTEARLEEIIRLHEAAGVPVFNPHAYTLEEGGMKQVDQAQLAFKRETDPQGLLNPGKMLAWDDPDWTPERPRARHLFTSAEPVEIDETLE